MGVDNYFIQFWKNTEKKYWPIVSGFSFIMDLCIGTTITIMNRFGKIPDINVLQKIVVSAFAKSSAYGLTSGPVMKSGPTDTEEPSLVRVLCPTAWHPSMKQRRFSRAA